MNVKNHDNRTSHSQKGEDREVNSIGKKPFVKTPKAAGDLTERLRQPRSLDFSLELLAWTQAHSALARRG